MEWIAFLEVGGGVRLLVRCYLISFGILAFHGCFSIDCCHCVDWHLSFLSPWLMSLAFNLVVPFFHLDWSVPLLHLFLIFGNTLSCHTQHPCSFPPFNQSTNKKRNCLKPLQQNTKGRSYLVLATYPSPTAALATASPTTPIPSPTPITIPTTPKTQHKSHHITSTAAQLFFFRR